MPKIDDSEMIEGLDYIIKELGPEHPDFNEELTRTVNYYINKVRRVVLPEVEESTNNGPTAERERFMEFVQLTAWFLNRIGGSRELHHKMMIYYGALNDLSVGAVHPMLQAAKLNNAAPANTDIWRVRATLSVALDLFVKAGVPLDEAAKRVTKIKGIHKILKPRADAAKSVKNWRNDISSGKTKNAVAAEIWKAGKQEYNSSLVLAKIGHDLQDQLKSRAKLSVASATREIELLIDVTVKPKARLPRNVNLSKRGS